MSTEHIQDKIAVAIKAARELKEKNDAEFERLQEEQKKANTVLIGNLEAVVALSNAARQQHEDESAERNKHLDQVKRIAGIVEAPAEDNPSARPEPTPEPDNPQTAVHQAVASDPVANPTPPAAPSPYDPRNWGVLEWCVALLGLLVFLGIALVIGSPHAHQHGAQWVVNILWYVGLPGLGLFIGGLIGHQIEERQNRR